MQVWNVLHAARWKYRTQKSRQKSPSGHNRTTLSGYIFATKARIDKLKNVKQQYLFHMSYGELRPTNGWDRLISLGHPCKFQLVSHLGIVTARHLVSYWASAILCGVEQRVLPIFGRAAITLFFPENVFVTRRRSYSFAEYWKHLMNHPSTATMCLMSNYFDHLLSLDTPTYINSRTDSQVLRAEYCIVDIPHNTAI